MSKFTLKRISITLKALIACFLILSEIPSFAAFSASAQWQVWNGGNDATTGSGGGFDPGGCTLATDGAATVGNTNAPVFTSASYNFAAGDVGHWIYIASGTNWIAGWYQIASVASNAATLTATIGTAQLLNKGLNTAQNVGNVNYAGGVTVSTASPTGASWTIDYSRKATSFQSYTDLAGSGSTLSSAAHPFGIQLVGNIISMQNLNSFTAQRLQILSISGTTITVDKAVVGTTNGSGQLGGAFASIGVAGSVAIASNGIWVKYNATAFSSTSTTSNPASGSGTLGKLTLASGTSTSMSFIRGYDTVCGDVSTPTNGLNRPTIKWGVNAGTNSLVIASSAFARIENLIFDGSTFTQTIAVKVSSSAYIINCKFINFNSSALVNTGTALLVLCEFSANSATDVLPNTVAIAEYRGCSFHDNTVNVITVSTGTVKLTKCNFYNNTGASTNNISATGAATIMCDNVTIATVGQHGFTFTAALAQGVFTNCYVQGAGGWGWNFGTAMDTVTMVNCGGFGNTSGNFDVTKLTNAFDQIGFLLPTGDVFNNLAGGDLTLNNTANRGALLRAAGWPSTYPGMTGTNYGSVGAYQPQGGSGTKRVPR